MTSNWYLFLIMSKKCCSVVEQSPWISSLSQSVTDSPGDSLVTAGLGDSALITCPGPTHQLVGQLLLNIFSISAIPSPTTWCTVGDRHGWCQDDYIVIISSTLTSRWPIAASTCWSVALGVPNDMEYALYKLWHTWECCTCHT